MKKAGIDQIVIQMPRGNQLDPKIARGWMDRNDKRLKPHIVAVPQSWRKMAKANRRFPRDCFARAIQFIHGSPHLPNALYVFGEAVCGGFQQHGWVELEDRVVFDGVMQQFYDRAGYYASEKAWAWYRFTRPAVMFMKREMSKDLTISYRWDGVLDLPWASDPSNLLLVDLERAKEGLAAFRMKELLERKGMSCT
jgi:hypothetical protein